VESRGTQVKKGAEATQAGVGAGPRGGAGQRFDRVDQRVAGIDIDTGFPIGRRRRNGFGRDGILSRTGL
jgi:hypothetical protein